MSLTARSVLRALAQLYAPPQTFLHYRTPLDLLVATILSAQCTDDRVNIVTETVVYPKYRTPADYLRVPLAELEEDVHACGTYRMKAKHIRAACALIEERFGGQVPQTMEELLQLPGVGRKTAAILLSVLFGKNEGIAVDTHVLRLSQRLGLTKHADPKRIELDLMEQLPRSEWARFNPLLISHGRAVCTARGRKCGACVFQDECPSSLVHGRTDRAQPKKSRKRAAA